jgi:hypothetical protein
LLRLRLHWTLLFRCRWSSTFHRTWLFPHTRLLLLRSYLASRLLPLRRRHAFALRLLLSHWSGSTLSLWRSWCSLYSLLLPFLFSLLLFHTPRFTR